MAFFDFGKTYFVNKESEKIIDVLREQILVNRKGDAGTISADPSSSAPAIEKREYLLSVVTRSA